MQSVRRSDLKEKQMVYSSQFVAVVKCDDKILREKDGIVFLEFGKEYSIMLKNLNSRKASVKVSIDGQDILFGKSILLNGNETQTLTRFVKDLDKGHKFKFIRKTQQISDYRGDKIDDGIIQIIYTFEEMKPITITTNHYNWVNPWQPYPTGPWVTYTSTIGGSGRGSSCGNMTADSNPNLNNVAMACCSEPKDFSKPLLNEGITTKGSISSQKFSYGQINELEENSHVIIIRLKGYHNGKQVEKPLMVKESLVCEVCGTKNRSSHKCCSECGSALEF